MDFPIKIILAPLIGGIIGYITNDLAIKMLFRPRKTYYIGKWHIPFTPGLIPQQKGRIAASIGHVISGQLLNSETVKQAVLSEETLQKMRLAICGKAKEFEADARTIEELLLTVVPADKLSLYKDMIQEKATQFLVQKIKEEDIGFKIVQYGMDAIREKLQLGMLGPFFDEKILSGAETLVSQALDDIIRQEMPGLIEKEIGKLEDDLLEKKLCDIYDEQKEKIPALADQIVSAYQFILENNTDKILKTVDIENIVVEKVSSFDAVQLEQMIFGIMKRELRAIVYLGALLGFMMGFINLLWK